jgi:hypothetical protein
MVKIEFLASGAAECPLIRLFEYRAEDVARLRQAAFDLADGSIREFVLHEQPWVQPVGGCRFVWRSALSDIGVKLRRRGEPFVMALTDEAWREVEGRLDPFVRGAHGFGWLTKMGDVQVLVSANGNW